MNLVNLPQANDSGSKGDDRQETIETRRYCCNFRHSLGGSGGFLQGADPGLGHLPSAMIMMAALVSDIR